MFQQPMTQIVPAGAIERPARQRTDRSMDVLQYGVALLAIVVAALLAAFH